MVRSEPLERAVLNAVVQVLADVDGLSARVRDHVERVVAEVADRPMEMLERLRAEREEIAERMREQRLWKPAKNGFSPTRSATTRSGWRSSSGIWRRAIILRKYLIPSMPPLPSRPRLRTLGSGDPSCLPRPQIKRLLREVVVDLKLDPVARVLTFDLALPPSWLTSKAVCPDPSARRPQQVGANASGILSAGLGPVRLATWRLVGTGKKRSTPLKRTGLTWARDVAGPADGVHGRTHDAAGADGEGHLQLVGGGDVGPQRRAA